MQAQVDKLEDKDDSPNCCQRYCCKCCCKNKPQILKGFRDELIKVEEVIQKDDKELTEYEELKDPIIEEVYVVFRSMEAKARVLDTADKYRCIDKCNFCCRRKCCCQGDY